MTRFLLGFALAMTLIVGPWAVGRAAIRLTPQQSPAPPPESTPAESVDASIERALALYRSKKYDEALGVCTAASLAHPDDHRPHVMAGYVYLALDKCRSASGAFAAAIAIAPGELDVYLLKADADDCRRAKGDAVQACRDALAIEPSFAEAYAKIGDLLQYDEKRRDEAVAAYRAAIRIDPQQLDVYEQLGLLLIHAEDRKGAEAVYRQGLRADPAKMKCRYALGRLLVEDGRLVEARTLWASRPSDEEDRNCPTFLTVLERAERLKQATDTLARTPKDSDALLAMGLAVMDGDHWVVDGRQERAIAYFTKALKLRPGFARAELAICKAYIELADTYDDKKPNVERELAKLRKLDPALAAEAEEYRKTYHGGFFGVPGGEPIDTDR